MTDKPSPSPVLGEDIAWLRREIYGESPVRSDETNARFDRILAALSSPVAGDREALARHFFPDAWSVRDRMNDPSLADELVAPSLALADQWLSAKRGEVTAGLLAAAKAVVARWETPLWKDVEPTAAFINRLRDEITAAEAALTTPAPDKGVTPEDIAWLQETLEETRDYDAGGFYIKDGVARSSHNARIDRLLAALTTLPTGSGDKAGSGEVARPVARAHVRLDDDGLSATLEVLDGEHMQVEHSPVDLYLAPQTEKGS